jgi:hypothetical protein
MAWARFDDGFYDHPKVLGLDPKLELQCDGLHLKAVCWCSRHLTDGVVPKNMIPLLNGTKKLAAELVRVGIWEDSGTDYVIHDYLDYNPSREKVLSERKAAQERMNKGRAFARTAGEQDANFGPGSPSPYPAPSPSPNSFKKKEEERRRRAVENPGADRAPHKSEPTPIGALLEDALATITASPDDLRHMDLGAAAAG